MTLREEHRVGAFENRMLRRILGPKKDNVIGENFIMKSFLECKINTEDFCGKTSSKENAMKFWT